MTSFPIAVVAATFVAVAAMPGCGSTCATNCPAIVFDIYATPGENLNIATAQLTGPGCPADLAGCRGDMSGVNNCVRLSLLAAQPGTCQLDMTFSDGRAPLSVMTEFGPETHQGCCHGFPVIGPAMFTVPPLHGLPDAGSDSGVGGPDAADGGAIEGGTGDAGDAAPSN